ncbi:retention module-containing protein, partial [Neptunomonas sp. XY-337]|uniref:retention module-containing protein n=1 Tax=Neptunomonas sp. XY-337 TaxID=2561897 RepID=UPI0010AAA559
MATVVGTVSFISGVVYAVKADGTERLLALGDEVFADEVLRTGPQAKVEITMGNGEVVALGEQQSWLVSAESFLEADDYPVEESVVNQDLASIDAIQQAILAGEDPTQVAEPTAAGTPAAGDAGAVTGNEGSSFTTISRTAQEGNPEAGFDTTGPGAAQQTQALFTPELLNRAPEATPDFITTAEDTPISDRIDATDADGDLLTYTLVSAPENGTAVVNADGSYTYTPNENYNGDDAFTVRVDDGRGGVIEVPVSVVITPVNDAPNANAFQETTPEDTPISSAVFTTDVDGDALTYSLGSGPSNGTVVINPDGTYTYTPSQDFNGNDRFFVTADDGNGGTTQIPVDIIVTPVNDAPTAGAFSESTPEDTPFTDSVFAQDVDGDTLTYSLNTGPSNGSVSLNANGTYTYTPNNGFIGSDSFTVTASDGNGGTVTIPVSINVFPVNDAPVALADSASTQENTPVLISVTGNDSDPDGTINPSTVNIISGPSNGSLLVNSDGTVEYTPNPGYTGPDSFQYTVQDNDGATSNVATVTIGVDAPVNLPPTATDDNQGVIEDTSATINLAANDSDPDDGLDLTSIVITQQPDHGTLVVNGDGTVTYTPDTNYNGPDNFQYTI